MLDTDRMFQPEDIMRRREFVAVLGGMFSVLPLVARAQRLDRPRRVGVLIGTEDVESLAELAAFDRTHTARPRRRSDRVSD
jgi:hypothetical protein